jgi:hypothetical protein
LITYNIKSHRDYSSVAFLDIKFNNNVTTRPQAQGELG